MYTAKRPLSIAFSSVLLAFVGLGTTGCQAPSAENGAAAAQTASAGVVGDACAASPQCAAQLICQSNICISGSGLSVMPRCTANASARITLMKRDPDATWIGDGPPPGPSYSMIGNPILSSIETGEIAWFPNVEAGTYIISMEGQTGGAQQTAEFDYDGSATLLRPVFDGFCYGGAPQG